MSATEIAGHDAVKLMEEVSKLGGSFHLGFYPCNLTKEQAVPELSIRPHCRFRLPLPKERWSTDSDNYFLFEDAEGNPKTCYKVLIRMVAFSHEDFKPKQVKWFP